MLPRRLGLPGKQLLGGPAAIPIISRFRVRNCHPVPKSVSEAILVFNSNFICRAFSSRPGPGADPGLWSPRSVSTTENKSFYGYGLERTPMAGAQEEEKQPSNRHSSSRLPEPCAWLGTGYESYIASSVPRSETLGIQCLRSARRRLGIAMFISRV